MIRTPLLLLAIVAVSSCDRAKNIISKVKEVKPAATASGSPGQPDVRDISEAEFAEFIKTPGKLVVIDYHAEWCSPCKMLGPVLSEVASEYAGRAVIGKVDIDQAPSLSKTEDVSGIPDVRFYLDGKRVDQFVGFIDVGQVRKKFAQHAPASAPAAATASSKAGPGGEGAATPEPAAPPIQRMKKDWLPPGIERR